MRNCTKDMLSISGSNKRPLTPPKTPPKKVREESVDSHSVERNTSGFQWYVYILWCSYIFLTSIFTVYKVI